MIAQARSLADNRWIDSTGWCWGGARGPRIAGASRLNGECWIRVFERGRGCDEQTYTATTGVASA